MALEKLCPNKTTIFIDGGIHYCQNPLANFDNCIYADFRRKEVLFEGKEYDVPRCLIGEVEYT